MVGFTVLVEEDGGERRWARVRVAEACTLDALHAWIVGAFGIDAPGPWSFTLAGRRPDEASSFSGPGEGWLRPAEEVEVGQLAWRAGVRWVHRSGAQPFRERTLTVEAAFDDGMALEVLEVERGAHGRDGGVPDAEQLAGRARDAAQAWSERLDGGGAPTRAELRRELGVAREVAAWIGSDAGRRERVHALDPENGLEWMVDLPAQASLAGMHEEALELSGLLRELVGEVEARGERLLLLQRAGRPDEARAEAEAWQAESPADPWAHLYAADLFAALGERERAEAARALAHELDPDDPALYAALVERRLIEAREVGDEVREAALEGELAEAIDALERDDGDEPELVDPNEPCPCGSGMKHKRCCGRGGAVPKSDAAVVVELLDEVAREGDQPEVAARLDAALPRFAGEALAGVPLGASLPLLPDDDLPEALVHWALLDCDLGDGTRVVERARRRLRRAGERERALFEQLCASAPTLWRVEALGAGRARLVDLIDRSADPRELEGVDDLPDAALVAARVLVLDGAAALGPGPVVATGARAERWLALVQPRFDALRAAEPDAPWPEFLRRHAHELYRPLAGD